MNIVIALMASASEFHLRFTRNTYTFNLKLIIDQRTPTTEWTEKVGETVVHADTHRQDTNRTAKRISDVVRSPEQIRDTCMLRAVFGAIFLNEVGHF